MRFSDILLRCRRAVYVIAEEPEQGSGAPAEEPKAPEAPVEEPKKPEEPKAPEAPKIPEAPAEEPKASEGEPEPEKKFTQDDLNNIVKERIGKFYKKYGVSTAEEFDKLINSYKDKSKSQEEDLAFLKNNIKNERFDDVKIYFKGKGEELNAENLANEVKAHPEWVKAPSVIKTGGVDPSKGKTPDVDDKEQEKRDASYFGLPGFIH